MIIQLLGSNGAGKSTLVRRVMMDYSVHPVNVEGRQKPLYYICNHKVSGRGLMIVGHYEIDCGGGDTIKFWSTIIEIMQKFARANHDILLEGPTGREYVIRDVSSAVIHPVWLQPALVDCVRGVQARGAHIDAERITRSANRCRRIVEEYAEQGVQTIKFEDRTEALYAVQTILRRAS